MGVKRDADTLIFSSGREETFNLGVVGISAIEGDFSISAGADNGVWDSQYPNGRLSKADLLELAEYMIARWREFASFIESSPESFFEEPEMAPPEPRPPSPPQPLYLPDDGRFLWATKEGPAPHPWPGQEETPHADVP